MNAPLLLHSLLSDDGSRAARKAVAWRGGGITHGELRSAALRIAAKLHALGIGTGRRVALCLPKSVEAVQLICGILTSGAAYVPLDAASPPSRLQLIVDDAQPDLIFVTATLQEKLGKRPNIVVLEDIGSGHGIEPRLFDIGEGESAHVSADQLAAILYTSGSTGAPKGVMLSHRNISCFVRWAAEHFRLCEDDVFASHAPFHFDLSTLDLFAPLHIGASVFLLDEKTTRFPISVVRALAENDVSILYAVPTALRLLEETGALAKCRLPSLRRVFFAGEVFPVPALRSLMRRLPQAAFVNFYGPTETNVCTYQELDAPPDEAIDAVPIGKACPHYGITLIDASGTPSDEGEICVSGPGVMLGYWRDEAKTAGCRLHGREDSYRTGDFARRDGSGNLHFLGRRDQQVKVRGYRVELLEVEAVLLQHPGVSSAAAMMLEPDVVAFVSPTSGAVLAEDDLRAHCSDRLQSYAVPSSFILLPSLPQTSTGKLDRHLLRQLASEVSQPAPSL